MKIQPAVAKLSWFCALARRALSFLLTPTRVPFTIIVQQTGPTEVGAATTGSCPWPQEVHIV